MIAERRYTIDITTNNKDIISVSSDSIEKFYLANIDEEGNETSYKQVINSKNLYANFMMLKINKEVLNKEAKDRILNKKDIINLTVSFDDFSSQTFDLAKKRILKNNCLINTCEDAFLDEDDSLCIIVTDKRIKYKKNLFA